MSCAIYRAYARHLSNFDHHRLTCMEKRGLREICREWEVGGERERGIEGVEMKKEGKNRRPVSVPASPQTSAIKKKATTWHKGHRGVTQQFATLPCSCITGYSRNTSYSKTQGANGPMPPLNMPHSSFINNNP